ncbi:DNA-binding protein NsdB [Kitasatospora griseola]|uniref:DNA-binding protein NsdB n=1 Tax=Kitasatospora griseola TaxID=2064 RepID=UPI003815E2AB
MSRGPNSRLADHFALTGWSKGELARLVNRRGAALGEQQLSTDTSRVRRWIEQGEIPRDPVPRVLAAVFTERLGRVVTTEDLGLERHRPARSANTATPPTEPGAPDRTAAVLTEFTGMDLMLNRRGLVGASAALAAGAVIADNLHDWLTGGTTDAAARPHPRRHPARGPVADVNEPGPVGNEEVAALERSVEVFRAWDASRGGGLQRKAVVGQLNEVGGLLAHSHPVALERRLWTVAANLAVLAGWMSHDVGLEPTAQRYFVIAAQAAREAGDRPRAAEAVSRAARQMLHLGRADDALELMQLARAGTRPADGALPRTRAMLCTVEAWAQASLGRSDATHRALGEAEQLFVQDADGPTPSWMQLFDEAELHGMQALVHRTLAEHDAGAVPLAAHHARQAIRLRQKSGRERSALLDRITLASVHWIADEPDAAVAQAEQVLDGIDQTSSKRTWDRLRAMDRLSARHQDRPAVAELRERIRAALPAPREPRPI